jgi:hypothetical protein
MYSKYDEVKDRILNKTSISYPQQKNTITKETTFNNGKPSNTSISEYDKNNLLLTRKNYNDKNELRSEFQYIFDTKGNWIELNYSYLVNSSYNGSDPKPVWRTKKYIQKIEYY